MTYVEECTSSTSSWFYSYGNPYSDVKQQEVRVQALPPGTGSHLRVVEREGFNIDTLLQTAHRTTAYTVLVQYQARQLQV